MGKSAIVEWLANILKKFDFVDNWAEAVSLLILIIAFITATTSGSAVILYAITLLFGMAFGRWNYRFKKSIKAPVAMITIGALIGLVLGSFYGDRRVVVLLFALGLIASYYLHDRKIIHSSEY